jgi:tetratricopeptide (TPR) repeat protein
MRVFCTIFVATLLSAPAFAQQPPGQDLEKLYSLGERYAAARRYSDALNAYQSALNMAIHDFGSTDERVLLALEDVYQTHVSLQNWSAAEQDRRQAMEIISYNHPPGDPALARERVRLAIFLAERQRYPECESLYRSAISSIESSPIASREEAPALMVELAHILRIENKNKEADEWEAKAKKIRMNRFDVP